MAKKEGFDLSPDRPGLSPEQVIFFRQRTVAAAPIAEQILNTIEENPGARRVLLTGLPGSGKTKTREALRQTLLSIKDPFLKVYVNIIDYDSRRRELLDYHGVESAKDLLKNGKPTKKSRDYARDLDATLGALPELPKNRDRRERWITIVEAPAVGNPDRNLGHTFMRLAGKQKNTIGLTLFGDQRLYTEAKIPRNAATLAKNDWEFKEILRIYGRYTGPIKDEDKESVELVKTYSRMGTSTMIDFIAQEQDTIVENALRELMDPNSKKHFRHWSEGGLNLVSMASGAVEIPDEIRQEIGTADFQQTIRRIMYAYIWYGMCHFEPKFSFAAINQFSNIAHIYDRL